MIASASQPIFEFEHANWQKSDCSGFDQISISYTDKTKLTVADKKDMAEKNQKF